MTFDPNLTPDLYIGSNVIDTYDDALTALSDILPFALDPVLSENVVGRLLDKAKVSTVWAANTVYNIGAQVLPTRPNRTGHRYKLCALQVGTTRITSNSTEPVWPFSMGGTINDGNGVWMENGPECDCWNYKLAASRGWQMKADLSAACFDKTVQRNQYMSSQVYKQMIAQAQRYAPKGFN